MPTAQELAKRSLHMPAVMLVNHKAYFLFCAAQQFTWWKSYYAPLDNLDAAHRIGFKNGPRVSECSPDGFIDLDGAFNLSITEDYRLTIHRGESFDSLVRIKDCGPCKAGTLLPDGSYVIVTDVGGPIYIRDVSDAIRDVITPRQFGLDRGGDPIGLSVTRITFMAEDPRMLLITGVIGTADHSYLVSLDTKRVWEIMAYGQPVYKCTIYQNQLYYAVRAGGWHEDRYIAVTSSYELVPV